MRNALPFILLLIVAPFVAGCQSDPPQSPSGTTPPAADPAGPGEIPVAYVNGKAVTRSHIYRLIAPAHGGEALAEILLDRAVQDRLKQETIEMTPADIDAEKAKLLASLDPDPDQAARLLKAMRSERGLDNARYTAMLRRNAGLRRLVRDQITINDAAIAQAYELRHGNRYQVRLIVADKLDTLTKARKQAIAGQSFTDLAIDLSTDQSANQGGLLSPISPADPTYPKAFRDALPKLSMNNRASRLSPAIALDSDYALLWLEEVLTPTDAPALGEARPELEAAVRADLERLRMRQLARTLIEQADVVVLDPALSEAWKRHENGVRNP